MRKWKNDFVKSNQNNESFYDLIDDFHLIEASFLKQYGIRLRTTEMLWSEFQALLEGLMHDTPLGQIVAVRSEKDPEILKNFTSEQRKIRQEWKSKQAQLMSEADYDEAMKGIEQFFMAMGGGSSVK